MLMNMMGGGGGFTMQNLNTINTSAIAQNVKNKNLFLLCIGILFVQILPYYECSVKFSSNSISRIIQLFISSFFYLYFGLSFISSSILTSFYKNFNEYNNKGGLKAYISPLDNNVYFNSS